MPRLRRLALLVPALLGSLVLLAATGGAATSLRAPADPTVEVVVTLPQAPLAVASTDGRQLAGNTTSRRKLDLRSTASVSYLRTLASAQRSLQARIQQAIPAAQVRWHYAVTLNGMAVVVPRSKLAALQAIPGATVWPSVTYHEQLDRTPQLIGAPSVWGPTLATAGQGMKIAIIDDGIDQTHSFFAPAGFTYPAGFPKGNTAFTTPKVIVARAFAPANETWKYARRPFDPTYSDHGINVAGIAAGDYNTPAVTPSGRFVASGIAPAAYLGNYKVLTVPTTDFGLDGNSPEIAKGIEQAVADGMDVLNLSLGEPEIEPKRDIVVQAINNAADAGVIPVIAAGNDATDVGKGSVGSPGTAAKAITVAASSAGDDGPADVVADFSSDGPTPLSLQLKPDVTAPGVDILSSLPGNHWSDHDESGTSMASPHVAGSAAVLKQRHPSWTPAQIKSALESTGDRVHATNATDETTVLREGGGRIDLPRADTPLLFTAPTSLSFGLVRRGLTTTRQLAISDAGGGPAPWSVGFTSQTTASGVSLTPSSPTVVAGTALTISLTTDAKAPEGDAMGYVVLTRGSDVRRIPYWAHIEAPLLGTEKHVTLRKPGVYNGNTAGKPARVSTYRYPEGSPSCNCAFGVPTNLSGPEQVFRVTFAKPVANFGVAIVSRRDGVRVAPRVVFAGDENRLVGYTALPFNLNPYREYGRPVPAAGAVLAAPASYDIVFDTPAGGKPGKFTFRYWVNDMSPPKVRLLSNATKRHGPIRFAIRDSGSGVDPGSITVRVGTRVPKFSFSNGILSISTARLPLGKDTVSIVVSDFQESRNQENVGPVLPNTRRVSAHVLVR